MSTPRRLVWAVPAATVAGVAAAALVLTGLVPTSASADPHPNLPARTAARLLAAVETSSTTALSGTFVQTSDLGLPTLPGSDSSAALTPQNLLVGSHTARIWVDGPDKQRLALLGQLAESDVVHNGADLWTYASDTHKVGHQTLKQHAASEPAPQATTMSPQALAEKALASVDPTTVVTVDRTQVVAGRPTYTLVLAPRDTTSTVKQVLISVDSKTSVPLRVQVFGTTGGDPAVQVGFTDVSFATPAASVFAFTPPQGSTVGPIDVAGQQPGDARTSPAPGTTTPTPAAKTAPVVHGTGWTSIVELSDGQQLLGALGSTVTKLTTAQADGSRLLSTRLVNALILPDGRVLVGAVTPAALQAAAAAA